MAVAHHTRQASTSRRAGEGTENYAKAIYHLQQRGDGPVHNGAIAERVGVTPASASAMVRRMADDDLVEHTPYHGVRLTERGEELALEVMRHHRLIEAFLAHLGMPWDRVHEEAERLEHVISEELEELIARFLGDPTHDPHGDPIPTADLEIDEPDTRRLSDMHPGERGTLVRISDSDPAMLRYLADLGVSPGDAVRVVDRQPFGGPLTVRFPGGERVLGGPVTEAMRVSVKQGGR
jgi:DtxR family transcriptional regulator, Mn-dependent transcriptional regulator